MTYTIKSSATILLFSFIVFSNYSFAQFGAFKSDKEKAELANRTLIAIVHEDHSIGFNETELNRVLGKSWQITPFKVVKHQEVKDNIDKYRGNPSYFFLTFDSGKSDYAFLSNDLKKNGKVVTERVSLKAQQINVISLCPILDVGDRDTDLEMTLAILKNGINKDEEFMDQLATPDPSIKNKTLLINQEYLHDKSESDIKGMYSYKFKLINSYDLANNDPANVHSLKNKDNFYLGVAYGKDQLGYLYIIDLNEKKIPLGTQS